MRGHVGVVELLLRNGARLDPRTTENENALSLACAASHSDCVKSLLRHAGYFPNAADVTRDIVSIAAGATCSTPLHLSSANGDAESVKALLGCNATTEARDSNEATPLHIACAAGHLAVVRVLVAAGAVVDAADVSGCTCLLAATRNGSEACVALLLEAHAELDAHDDERATPLTAAYALGHSQIATLLLEAQAARRRRRPDGSRQALPSVPDARMRLRAGGTRALD